MIAQARTALPSIESPWQDKRASYDCAVSLTANERFHIQALVDRFKSGKKGWYHGASAALLRLTQPLYETLDYLGATTTLKRNQTVRNTAVCLIIRAMNRWQKSYWGFTSEQWHELIGDDYYAYIAIHGCTANARHQIIAIAYLLTGFDELWSVGRLSWHSLASKIFGSRQFSDSYKGVVNELKACGYTETGNVTAIKCAVAGVFLKEHTSNLYKVRRETLAALHQIATAKITRRGLRLLSEVLWRAEIIPSPINRSFPICKPEFKHRTVMQGVSPAWAEMAARWYKTSTLQKSSKVSVLYGVLRAGRWFNSISPETAGPEDWDRQTCIAFIAELLKWCVGDFSTPLASISPLTGKPLKASTRERQLFSLRTFFYDAQDWEWLPRKFDPSRSLMTPASIKRLIGPDPRVVNDNIWAKLMWAGLNLTEDDIINPDDNNTISNACAYPFEMVKAIALTWLFSGLRRNEIRRLRLGCIRWESLAENTKEGSDQCLCLLDVPVSKTNVAFTKPVDGILGEAIDSWELVRPPQPNFIDVKTGEVVQLLFSHRGHYLGISFLNESLIPMLCKKAGVPQSDARGKITSHRARATIASHLYNAKQPLSLFELQEWLGHASPASTRHYAKITPTRLAKSFSDAGYFARNLRAIDVLIDRDIVESGQAGNIPWKFYDLGHGYCSYDFFDQCPHRMACAHCDFYLPKSSTKAQLIEGKANLLRMIQTITLTDEERSAIDDGVSSYERLLKRLEQVPTPDLGSGIN